MIEQLQQFLAHDAGPVAQFVKYMLSGGIATGVDVFVFYLVSATLLPALAENDPVRRFLPVRVCEDNRRRSRRFIANTCIAFVFSNLTAWILNRLFVFTPGRHDLVSEIALFYLVSGVALAIGTFLGWCMIRYLKLSTTSSYLGKLVGALLVNYVCRRFFIFQG